MAKKGFQGMGGMPNMNNMMKQVQQMQKKMVEMQEELNEKELETSAGGGAVTIKINGKKEILAIDIKPEVVDPDDVEMLQDLVLAAVNEALKKAEDETNQSMGKLTGGLNMPGMF